MRFYHVDVFATEPMNGNGLTVVFPERELESKTLLKIAQELKQFETIFVYPQNTEGCFPVRIFTTEEELAFAGHPILGAGAVLHSLIDKSSSEKSIQIQLPEKNTEVRTEYIAPYYTVTMNQGIPQWIQKVGQYHYDEIAKSLSMLPTQLAQEFPIEVVSTGLPYLLVPIQKGIGEVKINHDQFEQFLSTWGAKFVYVFEIPTLECRTWDNSGMNEDVATGSAAGLLCAYLVRKGFAKPDQVINISQGKYIGRPSIIKGWVEKKNGHVNIQGNVVFFGTGEISI
ncbi:MAG TPA: PhzF family phenazine biosynthesis protein [Firmicutes bacterium]|jgi:trans-2,3-dihydro-3-hydroxyanthranilate isomerase|nr:PhzF family phenazine biosynthesis protein [Bacillota bacterium]